MASLTASDVARFYQRLKAIDAPIDAGRCATCDRSMKIGDPLSAYVKLATADPLRNLPDGILVCEACTYQAMITRVAPGS